MIFENLPNDLKKHIQLYVFGHCDVCLFKNYFYNLKHNIFFYEYISIFHDLWQDLHLLKDPIKYKLICKYCFNMISKNLHYKE